MKWSHYVAVVIVLTTVQIGSSLAEVYSSVAKIQSLIEKERLLIDHLDLILNISQARGIDDSKMQALNRKNDCLNKANKMFQKSWNFMPSPIEGFRHVRRIYKDWQEIHNLSSWSSSKKGNFLDENLKSMYDVMSKWSVWPTDADVNGAALGLVKIAHVYDVFPLPRWLSNITSKFSNASPTSYHIIPLHHLIENDCLNITPDQNILSNINFLLIPRQRSSIDNQARKRSYQLLSAHDLTKIAHTALTNQFNIEARRWQTLIQTIQCSSDRHNDQRALSEVTEIFEQNAKDHKNFEEPPVVSEIQNGYVQMCQSSIKGFRSSHHSTDLCYWTYSWPYVIYNTEVVHRSPDIILFYDVISDSEINYIINLAKERMEPSQLPVNNSTKNRTNLLRVSQTAWLFDKTPVLKALSQRIGAITQFDTSESDMDTPSEPFQVVNYGLGGMYAPHQDSVKISRKNGKENSPALLNAGDRIATWMFYMSAVALGGATVFPAINVSVTPVKGSAVLWYNLHNDGTTDDRVIHAACPVVLGNKWVANKWIRERAQMFRRPCSRNF